MLWALVKACWRNDAGERPTFSEIVNVIESTKGLVAPTGSTTIQDGVLAPFGGVRGGERDRVRILRSELAAAVDLSALPAHLSDDLALLREVRFARDRREGYAVQRIQKMVASRGKLGCDDLHRRIVEEDIPAHELPGTAEARAASWQSNDWLSMSNEFEVVVLERFGAIKPKQLAATFPVAK